jgi:hypothetical protein
MKKLLLLLIFLLPLHAVQSQTLKEISRTRIDFGPEKNQIGIEQSAGEHWKPLFFAVDDEGLIHIPDFYKLRIAVFDKQGKLKAEKACPQGLSPRMNFFALAANGCYLTFNDGALYKIQGTGKPGWQYDFGPGVMPQRIFPTGAAVFVVFPPHIDADGRALVFDYNNSQPLGRFGVKAGDKYIPLIQTTQGIPFALSLAQMQFVPEHKGKYINAGDAALLYVAEDGASVWKQKNPAGETIYIFSGQGLLLCQGAIYYPEGVAGTGFWTTVDKKLTIYKNYFYETYMEIVGYRFGNR